MTKAEKLERLIALAKMRQATRLTGHACLADFHYGAYECDHVSPWTKSAANVDASIMMIAQDWASEEYLKGPRRAFLVELGYDPSLPTNRRLQDLLLRHFSIPFGGIYATNVFPFVKLGSMSASIPMMDMVGCAGDFCIPQIRIVNPKIAVCLGLQSFNALRRAADLRPVVPLAAAIESPFRISETEVFVVAHTGQLGTNGRGASRVEADWAALKQRFDAT